MEKNATVLKARFKPAKGAAVDGFLSLKSLGFLWRPTKPVEAAVIDQHFSNIKSYRWSKQTPTSTTALLKFGTDPNPAAEGGYTFVFSSFPDRDKAKNFYAEYEKKGKASGGAPAVPPPAPPPPSPHGTARALSSKVMEELKRRQEILIRNPQMQRLHGDLVVKGVITEDEFWMGRKDLLNEVGKRQRTGLPSTMLSAVQGVSDGRNNKVTFSLTSEIIAQIFAEKPAVREAFLNCVPAKMTAEEFWNKYVRAEYLFHTKNSLAAAAEAADDEYLALFVDEDKELNQENQRKVRKVDPTLDVATDDADKFLQLQGRGIVDRDGDVASEKGGQRKRSVFRDINRHAAVVLEGRVFGAEATNAHEVATRLHNARESDVRDAMRETDPVEEMRRADKVMRAVEMEDLEEAAVPQLMPLSIQDPRKYFDPGPAHARGGGDRGGEGRSPEAAAAAFLRHVADAKVYRIQDPVMPLAAAESVVGEVTKQITGARKEQGSAAQAKFLESLPEGSRNIIFAEAAAVKELLRHFWPTYPITTPMLQAKALRHKEAIEKIYDSLETQKNSCPATSRHIVSSLLQPIFEALNAALEHFSADAQKRQLKVAAAKK